MGFCRYCGDIVAGPRCKCGGTSVAPVVAFERLSASVESQDKWSKTYVSPQRSTSPVRHPFERASNTVPVGTSSFSSNPVSQSSITKRFPRPQSKSVSSLSLKSGVSDHITLATSQSFRSPSPLKSCTTYADADSDILPSIRPHESTLSKVYGSVLQPKDTLTLHSCAICAIIFQPDATIYPNPSPSSNEKTFLCKSCFTSNGGSKGSCPACSRPVLILKSEGEFIQSGGSYWHKRCYNCAGCFKNIGDAPMVDLLGRPSCVDCFDNCLKRDHPTTPKKGRTSNNNSPNPNTSNPGGLNSSYGPGRRTRESSPALEELEQRLGLVRSRESSPAVIDVGRKQSGSKSNNLNSPVSRSSATGRHDVFDGKPTTPQNLFARNLVSQSSNSTEQNIISPSTSRSTTSPSTWINDSISDLSGLSISTNTSPAMTTSTKSNNSRYSPRMAKTRSSDSMSISTFCGKCEKRIVNPHNGDQFVTIPGADENAVPQIYHTECFRCTLCDRPLNDIKKGSLSFTTCASGPCHLECAPGNFVARKNTRVLPNSLPAWAPTIPQDLPTWTSSKPSNSMPPPSLPVGGRTLLASPPSPSKPFPRFGGQTSCPGCRKSVSLMERGVVPGPQGSRWHAACLICGGKKDTSRTTLLGRVQEKQKGEPGCGKKLDSAAKSDGEGGVWCRECMLLLGGSPQTSPVRSPLVPSFTGTQGKINPQFTGTTTIARQFTGLGGGDAILRQLTGGGLSPTRSISPTKQLGMFGNGNGGMRPRPKSVIGMRNTKSIDEGRGMYLVRQLTGSTSSGGWTEA